MRSPGYANVITDTWQFWLANYFDKFRSLWHHRQSKSFSCIKSHCGKRPMFFWICCWWIRVLWTRNEWRTSVWIRNARHSCAIASVHYTRTKRTKMFKMPSNADKKMSRLGSLRPMQPFVLFGLPAKKRCLLFIVCRFFLRQPSSSLKLEGCLRHTNHKV
jgi:hypothetical protein